MSGGPRTVTMLLRAWQGGDAEARDQLVARVYEELTRIASRSLRGERIGHTLQPSDLVAEAYLRLTAGETPEWKDRVHFFGITARTMRQILVDHARKRNTGKRGDGVRVETLDEVVIGTARPYEMVALDDALSALAKLDERKARVVELHFFAGLTQAEVAEVVGVHVNTVANDLRFAEAWIHRELHAAP
jgi:RNA polymerase sigma factor (TIGR02999 family)